MAKGNYSDDLDAHGDQEGSAESRGGDHRPSQDNGTNGATFNVQGQAVSVNYPLPQDVNSPDGKDYSQNDGAEVSDLGLNERVEVGHKGGVQDYGFGGDAGGGLDRNTKS